VGIKEKRWFYRKVGGLSSGKLNREASKAKDSEEWGPACSMQEEGRNRKDLEDWLFELGVGKVCRGPSGKKEKVRIDVPRTIPKGGARGGGFRRGSGVRCDKPKRREQLAPCSTPKTGQIASAK